MKIQLRKTPTLLTKIIKTRRNKIKNFLYLNSLYVKQGEEIIASPRVKLKTKTNYIGDKILEVTFWKTAVSKIDNKIVDSANELKTIFDGTLLNYTNENTHVIYEFIIKRNERDVIVLDDNIKKPKNKHSIFLDSYASWDLINIPAILICGVTGYGKSRVSYGIIKQFLSIVQDLNDVIIVDPKRSELQKVCRRNFGLKNVFTDPIKMKDTIINFNNEMLEKYKELENKDIEQKDLPYKLLVIDEYANLKALFSKKENEEMDKALSSIASQGRACNFRLVLITQTPSTENINANLRNNLIIRIMCGNPANPELFKMAMGINRTEQQLTTKKRGQGYIFLNGIVQDFNSPKILFPDELEKFNRGILE